MPLSYYINTILSAFRITILCGLSFTVYAKSNNDVQQILNQINHFRMLHFLSPLKIQPELNQIAAQHSQEMAAHICPVGHLGFEKRFAKIRKIFPNTLQASENVAYGYKNLDEVVQGWIHSSGHRANILGPYQFTGIAIAYDQQHKPYYTQLFADQTRHFLRKRFVVSR